MRFFFFFKQKTAYEMRISDWSSDVCSSDLRRGSATSAGDGGDRRHRVLHAADPASAAGVVSPAASGSIRRANCNVIPRLTINLCENAAAMSAPLADRSEEHTSELQSLMRISYAVFCLKKTIPTTPHTPHN